MSAAAAASIVQVTMWNSPYLGNFMACELALARAVRESLGLDTHLVLGPGAGEHAWTAELDAAGIGWSVLPADRGAARAHLDAVVREHGGRLVHSHFTAADLPAAAAARAAGVPCVWHMHTGFLGHPVRQRIKDLWKIGVVRRRAAVRVIAVAPWLVDLALRRGVPAGDVVLLPNALVLERFATLPDREAARARLGLDPGATVAAAFGWWPHVKGADVALDALAELAGDGAGIHGLLLGEDDLRALVAQRVGDPPPRWLTLSGFVEDPAWIYAAADVFVSASRHEGQPYSVGEAIACGLPVVMSDIPGTAPYAAAPDVISFPSEDAAALARALATVAARPPAERERGRAANRAWAHEHLGVDRWCLGVVELYDELLTPHGAARAPAAARARPG